MTDTERIIEAVLEECDSVGRPRLAHETMPLTAALIALYSVWLTGNKHDCSARVNYAGAEVADALREWGIHA